MHNVYTPVPVREENTVVEVLRNYSFFRDGSPYSVTKNTTAFVNNIYRVEQGGEKFILRESRRGTEHAHVLLEVELLNYLHKKHFALAPSIVKNKRDAPITPRDGLYYTVQTFMPGNMTASWDKLTGFSLKRLKNFFGASALFSRAVQNFYFHTRMKNVTLADYVDNAPKRFALKIKQIPSSRGKVSLKASSDSILKFIHQTKAEFAQMRYHLLPTQLVHFDFHPGNVNFIGDKVSGIFDYDWIRFDSRITDIASTIAQSCYYFGGTNGGRYRKDRIHTGLQAYRKAYGKSEFNRNEENYLVKIALKGYVIFQLLFVIDEYVTHMRSTRHDFTLNHFVKLIVTNDYDFLFD